MRYTSKKSGLSRLSNRKNSFVYSGNRGSISNSKRSTYRNGVLRKILREDVQKKAAQRVETEDTIIRKEIHNTIIDMLNQGKGRVEIIVELNNKLGSLPDFAKYAQYFDLQISDQMKKRGIVEDIEENTGKDIDDEDGTR